MADLNGTWLGTYWQNSQPTRFEATLVQSNHSLSGNSLDDSQLGEAQLLGEVVGRRVQFSKRYLSDRSVSIDYSGTINDEENSIQGVWTIPSTKDAGNWEAKRGGNDLMQQLRQRVEQKIPVGI